MPLDRKSTGAVLALLLLLLHVAPAAAGIPSWLPRYDLDIHLDLAGHNAHVHQRVTWTNRHERPAQELIFNAHSHYQVHKDKVGFMAKMLEILRMQAGDSIEDPKTPPPLQIQSITLAGEQLRFQFQDVDNKDPRPDKIPYEEDPANTTHTALVVGLPRTVAKGESITVDIDFQFRLPPKQGRWGQWEEVTFLATWLPVVAVYSESGWQPTPFIPWHQPFFNEAGIYSARVTLPADQKIACTAQVQSVKKLDNGLSQVDFAPLAARDFAFLCSARYQEFVGQVGGVQVRCLAFPEHEHYAKLMVRWVCEALPEYTRWFGPYPYPQFTIAESYFGWNGNECAGLVMIDERIFNMPHLTSNFIEYLISHEFCHQWWYNVVGTNGYCETWMDEGFVTHFSHRLMDKKQGRNSPMLTYPACIEWLPNIHRENYRTAGMLGTIGRGDASNTVQIMPKYKHLVNLLSMCYDRGSRIAGMIEERLGGEAPFFEFMRHIYSRYQFQILRVDDLQRELEHYTGRDWKEFFDHWVRGADMCDWAVGKVKVEPLKDDRPTGPAAVSFLDALRGRKACKTGACKTTVELEQKSDYCEQTVLGICLDGGDGYQIRVPIDPHANFMQLDDPPATIEKIGDNRVRVEVVLPSQPTQITVDPDQVLVNPDRTNNHWKPVVRVHWAPIYSQLEETAFTNDYDKWNINFGIGLSGQFYSDPWYSRSAMPGARADLFRTEQFNGGAYLGYRTEDRSVVTGVDGLWLHCPWPSTQIGFNIERRLTTLGTDDRQGDRGVVFGRYVFEYGSSFYLPPMHFVELFSAIQDHALLEPRDEVPGADHFDHQFDVGVHYHLDLLTPYWDPEGGLRFDATYTSGLPILGEHRAFNRVDGQFSFVKGLPDELGSYLSDSRIAARVYGAAGLPDDGEYYTMGGGSLFRGFDVKQRQGSMLWVASAEWRLPVSRRVDWDCCDHIFGVRNVWLAPFYDVGNAYVNGHQVRPIAHAVGVGLRLDVTLLGLIERGTLRLDVAKTVNEATPLQFWVGFGVPF